MPCTTSSPAVSFTGSQAGILTDSAHTKARIVEIRADRINEALKDGNMRWSRLQGMSLDDRNITTSPGGSDTTAVARRGNQRLVCEIYTDVTGVFTADPRICPTPSSFPDHHEKCSRWRPWLQGPGATICGGARNYMFAARALVVRTDEGTWITKETPDMEQRSCPASRTRATRQDHDHGVHDQPVSRADLYVPLMR